MILLLFILLLLAVAASVERNSVRMGSWGNASFFPSFLAEKKTQSHSHTKHEDCGDKRSDFGLLEFL